MFRHSALEDTYLEVTTFAGMYDCKWTYRLSHGRNGWQLKCRNFPEEGGPEEDVSRVIEVDASAYAPSAPCAALPRRSSRR